VKVGETDVEVGKWKISKTLLSRVVGKPEGELTLEPIIEAELLYQECLEADWPEPVHHQRLTDIQADLYLRALITRFQEAHLETPTPGEERAFFEENRDKYKARLQLDARILSSTVPEKSDPLVWLDHYTDLARQLREGELDWSKAEAYCAPECHLRDPPMVQQMSIANQYGPVAVKKIKSLAEGGVSDPIQDQMNFHIIQVQSRKAARLQTFEEALPRVRRGILHNRRSALSEAFVRQLLAKHHFSLTTEGLARTRPAPEAQDAELADP
jgi:hypothetical protein